MVCAHKNTGAVISYAHAPIFDAHGCLGMCAPHTVYRYFLWTHDCIAGVHSGD